MKVVYWLTPPRWERWQKCVFVGELPKVSILAVSV
jgi:hypothetical protein